MSLEKDYRDVSLLHEILIVVLTLPYLLLGFINVILLDIFNRPIIRFQE